MQTFEDLLEGKLAGSQKLKLSCGLTDFPRQILDLAETLELLDLSGNKLSDLPENFSKLKKLKILFLSDNEFTTFPAVLADCENLEMIGFKANKIAFLPENALPIKVRWLILTNNQIPALPKSIGKCLNLQKVMFAGNNLNKLPDEMSACRNIELLRISANQIEKLPDWLLKLPKLSWLAFAGNPFCKKPATKNELQEVDWNELVLGEKLGEGASGIISKAKWQKSGSNKDVAVKVFKGEVTSDGLPEDEMAACITAGEHLNLVHVIGKLKNHPLQKKGLIFSLIPPGYRNLGGTPSFESCTRDVFEKEDSFSIVQIIKILAGVASVAVQIHQKGISHGDLYAHNILIDENANPLFGDFGAGAFYDKSDSITAEYIEKIEVRAFGCLMEDLLGLVRMEDKSLTEYKILSELQLECFLENVLQRPLFNKIYSSITKLL